MKILKSNSERSYKYLLIVPTLLSIFSFFSFKAYNVPTDYSFIELVTHDTLPFEENDTIITLDASTGIETMSVVKRTNYDPAEIEKILKYKDSIKLNNCKPILYHIDVAYEMFSNLDQFLFLYPPRSSVHSTTIHYFCCFVYVFIFPCI